MTPKEWLGIISEYGCVVTGRSDIQRHHVVGRKYRHNKVYIGEWFVLPLWCELHDVHSNNEFNVTHHRHKFTDKHGMQRDLFQKMCIELKAMEKEIPDQLIIDTIMTTRY